MSLRRFTRGVSTVVQFGVIGVLLLAFDFSANAQSAALSGNVVDASGGVVADARVALRNEATNAEQQTRTNREGIYFLSFVKPGTYTLQVEAKGFKQFERTSIVIETAQSAAIDVRLEVGDRSETVTVDGSGLNINTIDASVSTLVDRKFVENIPLNGRSFQSLMALVPGTATVTSGGNGQSGQMTVNGQRTEANYFLVDGVSANVNSGTIANPGYGLGTAGITPGLSVLGTTQPFVSIDALQEFRAVTSTYSAEYGRTPGGQFTFQTRSGTNDFHGNLFNYFRNDVLDANNWFNNANRQARSQERQNDFGGTLGGPIFIPRVYNGRNRTFFFFSYEGLRLRVPATINTQVPALWLRKAAPAALQPYLNAFQQPTPENEALATGGLANYYDSVSNPTSLDTTSIRVDHNFSTGFRVFGRFSDAPSNLIGNGVAGSTNSIVNLRSVTLGATNLFSPRVSNDFRFNFTDATSKQSYLQTTERGAVPYDLTNVPGLREPNSYILFYIYLSGVGGTSFGKLPRDTNQKQFNITNTTTAVFGKHNLKWGLDWRRLGNIINFPPIHERPFFYTLDSVLTNKPTSLWTYKRDSAVGRPIYTNFSTFIQDEWKLMPRVNLSLGLRWDVNPAPSDPDGRLPYTINSLDLRSLGTAPQGTPLWNTAYGNFAPRLGLAWHVHQSSGFDTVLRSGVGLFYDIGVGQESLGYAALGYSSSFDFTTVGGSFPLTQAQLDSMSAPSTAAPYNSTVYGYDPNLKLPRSWQWNVAIEQGLGKQQTLTVSYVGSSNRKLLYGRSYAPAALGNPNFQSNGLFLTTNDASSDYNALQAQFTRRLSQGLQVLASYTWSHALDNASSNTGNLQPIRASSDFDIRNNFQAAVTYQVPGRYQSKAVSTLLADWAFDTRIMWRSSLPVDIVRGQATDPVTGGQIFLHPDRIPGVPLYRNDPNAPGGRVINCDAFIADCNSANLPAGEGNAGRNIARGFSAFQTDIALRKNFRVSERIGLQFRAEAFNVFNHPIFGSIRNYVTDGRALFGYANNTQNNQLGGLNSLYQIGGPRSMQLSLKLQF